jgi:ArsR family transcriptional regulator
MQPRTKLDKALETLVCSRRCEPDDVPRYKDRLIQLVKDVTDTAPIESLKKIYRALGDETRLKVVYLLQVQEMCVCEIMAALGLTQPTASHHLMILENAGVVKHRKEGRWVFYSITDIESINKLLPRNG